MERYSALIFSMGSDFEEARPPMAEHAAQAANEAGPIVLTEVAERIGTITLNRPERRNALNGELIGALEDAVRAMAEDSEVKVVVLTGAASADAQGGFCSGGDVKDGAAGPGGERGVPVDALAGDLARHDDHAAMRLHLMPKPTIAMVGGPAIGAGCSLAAACDLRFASDEAVFSVNFTPNGLAGDYGGSFFWTRIGGTALARRLYLLNERIPAARALELGMVHAVLPAAELRQHTYEVAGRLTNISSRVMALVKDDLNQAEDEVARRRWLFAHEAENQIAAARGGKRRRPPESAG
jgi:2-(1,2-epoxy-1,2-dihydrophenyl)acetyl-CoA isomerase